uniref:Kinesin motor domain-containing protein n=1 Tax=Nothobranchius pienaari TaxID=704102 RepID=A0A1A8MGF3_9TELE
MDSDVPAPEPVRVGVVLVTNSENADCVVDAEGRRVDYRSTTNEDSKSFIFDQVVGADHMESLHSELLQTLPQSTFSSCNGALLMCGASTETIRALTDQGIVRKVLTNLFSCISSRAAAEVFTSVSFLQFYPDGSAVDLLSLNKENLQLVTHPVLGSVVGGLSEVCVCSAEEAFSVYETCREMMKTNAGIISSRCSSLLSVVHEWKLHPEQVESDVCCGKLQLFSLAGGASRTDLRGVSPLLKVLDQMKTPAATDDNSLLLALLKDALTGNIRTYLIYCINPQGLLDVEIPSALDLAQRVRGCATKAQAVRWNPKQTERGIREGIMELQTIIMSQRDSDVHSIHKLAEMTQNLQSQLEYNEAQERRRQLKEDHARLMQEEVVRMEEDLAREQPPTEGPQRELLVLSRERRILVLQMEALRTEAQQAETDLQDQHQRHQTELHCLREESLQVFRVFRQVSEEQRKLSEGRYRSLLLEAVQDAVYLSAQNQQLQADNKQLHKALGEIKDALVVRGDPRADLISQQE